MQNQFLEHLQKNFTFLYKKKILLAVSGGIDSVVLVHLCKLAQLNFSVAHCNFQLRGEESNADVVFVETLAEKLKVPFFTTVFDTKKIAKKEQLSTQLAARKLRYQWFSEIMENKSIDFLFTAHHADDNLETFLINTIRGTGLQGLTGIPEQNEKIIRPLLPFDRKSITAYAKKHKIEWREDRSNASDAYFRNRIRHHLVPLLKEENENFLPRFLKTQQNLQQSEQLIEDYTTILFSKIVTEKAGDYHLAVQAFADVPHPRAVLYQLLNGFGFTAWEDIYQLLSAQVGKEVLSPTHRLIRDRDFLLLTARQQVFHAVFEIERSQNSFEFPNGRLEFSLKKDIEKRSKSIAYLSLEKIQYPLKLRRWKSGDRFRPFGMTGTKKVSDFLKDEHCSPLQKEQTWVLLSEEKILWVVGHRIDDRFKVGSNSSKTLKVEFSSSW